MDSTEVTGLDSFLSAERMSLIVAKTASFSFETLLTLDLDT